MASGHRLACELLDHVQAAALEVDPLDIHAPRLALAWTGTSAGDGKHLVPALPEGRLQPERTIGARTR
jgi:hypothetical protein